MRFGHSPRRSRVITTDFAQRQGGFVLLKFALLLVPLLLMVGLSVDVGYWYNRTAAIQKAADAAALAGVVWLPDVHNAETYALEAAARNGFVDGVDGVEIEVAPEQGQANRLRVRIRDTRVGSFFYEALSGKTIPIGRDALAEYVEKVPLGSPKNYFGTGLLLDGDDREYLFQSVNPACTDKYNGDRYQSLHFGDVDPCPDTPSDAEYREGGYELYIEAKEDRPSSIDVMLYDPRYNQDALCTVTWTPASGWTTSSSSSNVTINGLAQYQTRSSSSGSWSSTETLQVGQSYTRARNRIRYRIANPCPYDDDGGIDDFRRTGNENYTFTLYSADDTPLDDRDNPIVPGCQVTYSNTTAFDAAFAGYLGSRRWNRLCVIDTSMPAGKYILRVQNAGGPGVNNADGSNQWGLVAKYQTALGDALCDGRVDAMCPRVYGKDAISVRAAAETSEAEFFLAEIAPAHAGKILEIELYDPGEGGNYIQILEPTGADTWEAVEFDWRSFWNGGGNHDADTAVTQVDVTGSAFNGKRLQIRIDLTGYSPPANNRWWKIYYNFDSGTAVTDRTTWSAQVWGDPVHLLEDEA